jgi:hypothetical protein
MKSVAKVGWPEAIAGPHRPSATRPSHPNLPAANLPPEAETTLWWHCVALFQIKPFTQTAAMRHHRVKNKVIDDVVALFQISLIRRGLGKIGESEQR